MEWFKLIIELIKVIIWPITVLIILRYRHDILGIITKNLKTFKYGNAEFDLTKDLNVIEKSIEQSIDIRKIDTPKSLPSFQPKYPHLSIVQIRIEFENELFKLFRVSLNEYRGLQSYNIGLYLREDRVVETLGKDMINIAKEFLQISNNIIHSTKVSNEIIERAIAIGSTLVTDIHYKRKVYEMVDDFKGHGLWHMHRHLDEDVQKYYFYSAVTASLPEFDYNYDIYKEAATIYTEQDQKYHGINSKSKIYILSLEEFIISLEHREHELKRLLDSHSQNWNDFEKANEWQWPSDWGHLGWTGPIIRDRLSTTKVRDELTKTQTTLNYYRSKLLLPKSVSEA